MFFPPPFFFSFFIFSGIIKFMGDLDLIQECVKGNKQAWDDFVDTYSRLIYNYIRLILKQKKPGLLTRENICDIFQDIFVCLSKDNFKKLNSFKAKNGCTLASWLRQVSVNFTLDYVRKSKPLSSLDEVIGEGVSAKDMLVDTAVSVEDKVNVNEKAQSLKECIEKLELDDKYFIEFFINRGLSLEVMKGLFNISRGAIDMRKSRIIGRLRECFKSKGFLVK
jgi:RNA polymerase sigma-70 factor (ECF subfamily)